MNPTNVKGWTGILKKNTVISLCTKLLYVQCFNFISNFCCRKNNEIVTGFVLGHSSLQIHQIKSYKRRNQPALTVKWTLTSSSSSAPIVKYRYKKFVRRLYNIVFILKKLIQLSWKLILLMLNILMKVFCFSINSWLDTLGI